MTVDKEHTMGKHIHIQSQYYLFSQVSAINNKSYIWQLELLDVYA